MIVTSSPTIALADNVGRRALIVMVKPVAA